MDAMDVMVVMDATVPSLETRRDSSSGPRCRMR